MAELVRCLSNQSAINLKSAMIVGREYPKTDPRLEDLTRFIQIQEPDLAQYIPEIESNPALKATMLRLYIEYVRKFHVGQRVRITKGVFELCEGEIERVDSRYRLSVLIDFLGAKSSLQLDEDGIEAV